MCVCVCVWGGGRNRVVIYHILGGIRGRGGGGGGGGRWKEQRCRDGTTGMR